MPEYRLTTVINIPDAALIQKLQQYLDEKGTRLRTDYSELRHIGLQVHSFQAKTTYWERVLKPEIEHIVWSIGATITQADDYTYHLDRSGELKGRWEVV